MVQKRVEMEATILPNGKVLVDSGSAQDEDATTASLKSEIYDPATNSFSPAGSNTYPGSITTSSCFCRTVLSLSPAAIRAGCIREPHRDLPASYFSNADGSLATRPRISAARPVRSLMLSHLPYPLQMQVISHR